VSPRDAQQPAYVAVFAPMAGLALLIWWMMVR
jgi:hypothetical protein